MSLIFSCEIGVEEHEQCVYHAEGIAGFDRNGNERKEKGWRWGTIFRIGNSLPASFVGNRGRERFSLMDN